MMDQEIVLESIWVAVGFVVFVVLIWRKVGAALGSMLDERSEKISNELKEAAALRDDALEELQVYRRLHREAAAEAKNTSRKIVHGLPTYFSGGRVAAEMELHGPAYS